MSTNFKSLRLFFIIPLFLILTNCQEDNVELSNQPNITNSTILRFISLNDIKNIKGFENVYREIPKKSSDSIQKINSLKYDFWIQPNKVLLVQKGDYCSLTFPVYRNTQSDKLENFFLHPYNGDIYLI